MLPRRSRQLSNFRHLHWLCIDDLAGSHKIIVCEDRPFCDGLDERPRRFFVC